MMRLENRFRNTLLTALIVVGIMTIGTAYSEIDCIYLYCSECRVLGGSQTCVLDKGIKEIKGDSVKTTSKGKLKGVQNFQDRILIMNVADYETALSITDFPYYVTDEMKIEIMKYAYNAMDIGQYEGYVIIWMINDKPDNGIICHFILNGQQYLCTWFNNESHRYITIYDKIISDLPKDMGQFTI